MRMAGAATWPRMAGLTSILCCLLSFPVVAQSPQAPIDPARMVAAKALMEAQGGIAQAQKALEQMTTAMVEQVRKQSPSEADGFQRFMQQYLAPDSQRVTAYFNAILQASTMFYAERCTVEELKAMTAFMATPTGQKFVSLAPELGAVMAPELIRFQKDLIGEVQAAAARGEFKK